MGWRRLLVQSVAGLASRWRPALRTSRQAATATSTCLTRDLSAEPGSLEMGVQFGLLEDPLAEELNEGFAGYRIGIRGAFNDYRDSAVRGYGMNAGVTTDGRLFIGELTDDAARLEGSLADDTPQFEARRLPERITALLFAPRRARTRRNRAVPEFPRIGSPAVSRIGRAQRRNRQPPLRRA